MVGKIATAVGEGGKAARSQSEESRFELTPVVEGLVVRKGNPIG